MNPNLAVVRFGIHKALLPILLFSSGFLSTAGLSQTYTTTFDGDENPLSESGKWLHNGLDWAKIRKSGQRDVDSRACGPIKNWQSLI